MTKEDKQLARKTAYLSVRDACAAARNNYYVARGAYTLASDAYEDLLITYDAAYDAYIADEKASKK